MSELPAASGVSLHRVAVRRSAPIGLAIAAIWLGASVVTGVGLLRWSPFERASWSDALARTLFGYFGWGWFVTVALAIAVAVAACLLLRWSRPTDRSLVWAIPLIAVMVLTLLDGLTRVTTRTQWLTPADEAAATWEANVSSLVLLVLVAVASTALGVAVRLLGRSA